jgi:hypothetical protein
MKGQVKLFKCSELYLFLVHTVGFWMPIFQTPYALLRIGIRVNGTTG